MCFDAGRAEATVKSSDTTGPTGQYVAREKDPRYYPDAPDFNDELIQEARKRMAGQLIAKSSRRSALANNPGAASPSYTLLGT